MVEAAAETDGNAGNTSTPNFFFLLSGPASAYTNPEMMPSFLSIGGPYGGW